MAEAEAVAMVAVVAAEVGTRSTVRYFPMEASSE